MASRIRCVCVVLVGLSTSISVSGRNLTLHGQWEEWMAKYDKRYNTGAEEFAHREIWETNLDIVETHNNGVGVHYKLEMNEFSDLRTIKKNTDLLQKHSTVKGSEVRRTSLRFVPTSWDWRTKGAITPVQNQPLANVFAIVLTETVESFVFIKSGRITDLSTAEAGDCCANFRLQIKNVFQCVHNIGGLCSGADYPKPQQVCRNGTCTPTSQIQGGKTVPEGDENQLLLAVLETPLMVVVDASHVTFQLYQGGVYSDPNCSPSEQDHAMQLVGYGVLKGQDYWICKNSWGTGWGMGGYMLMSRNKDNMCGIASRAEYPV